MSGAVWFGLAVVVAFVLRGIVATVIFLWLLPEGTRCPVCDEVTLRVQSRWWNRLLPRFRTSWCPACHWAGLLQEETPPRGPGTGATRGAPSPGSRRA